MALYHSTSFSSLQHPHLHSLKPPQCSNSHNTSLFFFDYLCSVCVHKYVYKHKLLNPLQHLYFSRLTTLYYSQSTRGSSLGKTNSPSPSSQLLPVVLCQEVLTSFKLTFMLIEWFSNDLSLWRCLQ